MSTGRALRVGLTGGIGSGKTAASNCFASLGATVIDADEITRRITRKGGSAYRQVAELFGPGAVAEDGELRRDVLREQVFRDPGLRQRLEEIIHPLVYDEIRGEIEQVRFPYCIICIPLLLETRSGELVDRVLVVDAPERLQVERVMRRDGVSAESVERIMENQQPRAMRLKAADDLILNDRDEKHLKEQVARLHEAYLALSREYIESSS